METSEFRSMSLVRLSKAGVAIPSTLPLLDEFAVRSVEEILDRLLCLNAVAAVAHGFDREKASAWLSQEGLLDNLTQGEHSLLLSGAGNLDAFKVQVEGIATPAFDSRTSDIDLNSLVSIIGPKSADSLGMQRRLC